MKKSDFLRVLKSKLSHLSKAEVDERLNFYSEMIDDRMESGLSEKEAVEAIGSANEIAHQISEELRCANKDAKSEKRNEKRRTPPLLIILLILGSPVWLSLLIAAAAVVLSIIVVLWSVIISLWAVFGSLVGAGVGIILAGIYVIINVKAITGIAFICTGFVCLGLSILLFYASKAATVGAANLTKNIVLLFLRKKGDE